MSSSEANSPSEVQAVYVPCAPSTGMPEKHGRAPLELLPAASSWPKIAEAK